MQTLRRVTSIASYFIVLTVVAGCASVPAASSSETQADRELKARLCAESPWSGTVTGERYGEGKFDLAFYCKGGFSAEILRVVIPGASPPAGKVHFLRIEDGVVKYLTSAGSLTELRLDSNGRLVGEAHHQYGGTFKIVLYSRK